MSSGARCDRIIDMIDQALTDCGVPIVGASIAAVPANGAGHRRDTADAAPAPGLRSGLQRDVMGAFSNAWGNSHG